jgi:hypothetical protein
VIALPRGHHRGLPDMCCCGWDFNKWVRTYADSECPTHGAAAAREKARKDKQQKLVREKIAAAEILKSMHSDLALLPLKIKECERLIQGLNQQLKELAE